MVGGSDIPLPDPNAPNNCINTSCFLNHGFRWQAGVLTDLGALPAANQSRTTSVNAVGWATGGSSTATFDPLTGTLGEPAVLWKNRQIVDLGTLGTGLESAGLYVNNAGEVIGYSTFDQTPDPNSFKGATIHAFIWKNGIMREIVPLGSRGSFPWGGCSNQRSELVADCSDSWQLSSGQSPYGWAEQLCHKAISGTPDITLALVTRPRGLCFRGSWSADRDL